jgi:hypothetical protein
MKFFVSQNGKMGFSENWLKMAIEIVDFPIKNSDFA